MSNKLGFYKKESGNFTTHKGGLTEEQVEFLQSLKPGDRMIIYINRNKAYESGFDANLKKLETKTEDF